MVKFSGDGTCYRILGMEHQQHIHYAMPLRTMIYDSLSYLRQAEEISRRNHREKAWGDRDEFLSGLKKDDRLIPCYTAVLYCGFRLSREAALFSELCPSLSCMRKRLDGIPFPKQGCFTAISINS